MSKGRMHEIIVTGSRMVEKILSIRVAELAVTRVGLLIVGRTASDRLVSRNSLVRG